MGNRVGVVSYLTWSIVTDGVHRCVLGEMFMRRPILPGTTDVDQLEKIWALCGTPNQHTWPNYDDLPGCDGVKRFDTTYSRRLRQAYDSSVHLSFLNDVKSLISDVLAALGQRLATCWISC